MEIKDIAGERFASGRAPQQQRKLTISHGVLRKIVVNQQRMAAILADILAHGAAAIRGNVLQWRGFGGRGGYHGGVVHGA